MVFDLLYRLIHAFLVTFLILPVKRRLWNHILIGEREFVRSALRTTCERRRESQEIRKNVIYTRIPLSAIVFLDGLSNDQKSARVYIVRYTCPYFV